MRKKGLEPPRLAAPDPKSGAATSYAKGAYAHSDRRQLSSLTLKGSVPNDLDQCMSKPNFQSS